VTTTLPALDSTTHVSSVLYACTFAETRSQGGLISFMVPAPVQFTFTFDTGITQPDPAVNLYNVTSDSSWFDQAATEASIKSALDSICTTIAGLLSTTQAVIQATVTVKRTWRIRANSEGSAAPVQLPSTPVTYIETMAYP
jgi:hypothetical protein